MVQSKVENAAAFVISIHLSEVWPTFIALNSVHPSGWEQPQMSMMHDRIGF